MSTSELLLQRRRSTTRQARYAQRKRVNRVALTLSLAGHGVWPVLAGLDPVWRPFAWALAGWRSPP